MNQCFLDRTGPTLSQARLPTSGVASRSPPTPRLSVRSPPPPPLSHQGRRAESNPLAWTFINGSTNPTFIKSPQCCANPFHPPPRKRLSSYSAAVLRSSLFHFVCSFSLGHLLGSTLVVSFGPSSSLVVLSAPPSTFPPPRPARRPSRSRAPPFRPTNPRLTEPLLPREGSWVDSPTVKVSSRWRDIGRVMIKVGRIFDYFRRTKSNRESLPALIPCPLPSPSFPLYQDFLQLLIKHYEFRCRVI